MLKRNQIKIEAFCELCMSVSLWIDIIFLT